MPLFTYDILTHSGVVELVEPGFKQALRDHGCQCGPLGVPMLLYFLPENSAIRGTCPACGVSVMVKDLFPPEVSLPAGPVLLARSR